MVIKGMCFEVSQSWAEAQLWHMVNKDKHF